MWLLVGASHRMADFFAVAPATEAPGSFTGGVMVVWVLGGVVLLVVVLGGGGGVKRFEMLRSRRWRLARSVAMVSSMDCIRLTVALVDSWICLLTTAVIVLGGGGGVSLASMWAVALAEHSRRCLEATLRMFRAMALWAYWLR